MLHGYFVYHEKERFLSDTGFFTALSCKRQRRNTQAFFLMVRMFLPSLYR